jgi:hemin uptake protein HemP
MSCPVNSQEENVDAVNSAPPIRAERKVLVIGDRVESRDLFAGVREIIIGHGSDSYRLRLTAQNKLILTK